MKRMLLAVLLVVLFGTSAYAQQWDQVNGSMQVKSGPSAALVIIDQTNTAANRKILSLRAAGTEKCSFDIDGDMTCAGSFTFVNLTFTGQAIGPLDTDCSAPAYSGLGKLTTGIAVRTAPSVATCVGGALIDLTTATAKTMQSTFTFATTNGGITANRTSLGTTPGLGLAAINTTAAAAGAQQISPYVQWRGNGWKTDATAASQTVDFFADVLPVQGAAAPTGSWRLGYSINGGATTNVLDVSTTLATSTVSITTTGTTDLTAGRDVLAAGVFRSASASRMSLSTADGRAYFTNDAADSFSALVFGPATTGGLRLNSEVASSKFSFVEGDNSTYAGIDTGTVQVGGVTTISITDPTIASGGCTAPAITWANGTAAFLITIGTSCTGVKTVTLTLPATSNLWACDGHNNTSDAQQQTNYPTFRATSTTAVVLTSYDRVTGLQEDFTASDTYLVKCLGG